jgi:hypothetical protein
LRRRKGKGERRKEKRKKEKGETRNEKGERRKEKRERRKEKGERRKEKGEDPLLTSSPGLGNVKVEIPQVGSQHKFERLLVLSQSFNVTAVYPYPPPKEDGGLWKVAQKILGL